MAPRKNGNGKNLTTQLEAMEMVTEPSASPIELSLSWPESVALSGTLSAAHLQEILCQKLGNREPKIWESVPLEHRELLTVIKNELTDAPKQLSEASQPVLETLLTNYSEVVEQPVVVEKKKRGRPSKAELARRNQEANEQALQKAQDIQKAQEQQAQQLEENREHLRRANLEAAVVEEFVDFTEEQELRLNVQNSLNKTQINNELDTIDRRMEAVNSRLQNLGSGYRLVQDSELQAKAQESAEATQKHKDFLSQWKTQSWLQTDEWA